MTYPEWRNIKIKGCPLCGTLPEGPFQNTDGWYHICCAMQGNHSVRVVETTPEEAIEVWNHRDVE